MKEMNSHDRKLVIGIGNEFRSDDGVGLMIGCRIREMSPSGVDVLCLAGEGGDLLRVWRDYDFTYMVDAVRSGASVGTIHRIDLHKQRVPAEFTGSSSHSIGIAESVELGRVLGILPSQCIFFGIEVGNVGMGTKVSKRVVKAADEAVHMILCEMRSGVEHLASVA